MPSLDASSLIRIPALRTTALYVSAAVIGLLGWSGSTHWAWLSLVFPFLYLQSRRRLDTLLAVLYYAGATWSVMPGASVFFGNDASRLLPIALSTSLQGVDQVLCRLPANTSSQDYIVHWPNH